MISSRLAEGVLAVVVLASLAGAVFQAPLNPGEEGAMFVDAVVLEQPVGAEQSQAAGNEAGELTQSSVAGVPQQ